MQQSSVQTETVRNYASVIFSTFFIFINLNFVNMIKYFYQCVKKNLVKCINTGMFSDVTFELDDGQIKSHRAMLIARCDMMRAMLSGDFREAHANVVC